MIWFPPYFKTKMRTQLTLALSVVVKFFGKHGQIDTARALARTPALLARKVAVRLVCAVGRAAHLLPLVIGNLARVNALAAGLVLVDHTVLAHGALDTRA